MSAAGFRPRREPGAPVATRVGPIFVARRRAPRATAPPLVLVHGWCMAHGYFSGLVDALAGERELFLVDLPGYGESACPSPRSFSYDFDGFVEILDEVTRKLGLRQFDLLGHSLGGGVALRYALDRSEVRRLIVIAPLAFRIPDPPEAVLLGLPGLGPLLWRRAVRRRDFARQMRRDVEDTTLVGDAYVDWAWSRFNRPGARAASYATLTHGRRVADDDTFPRRITQPTLVVWGEADRLIPREHGRRLVERLPDGRLAIVPATGHTPFVERPGLVMTALRRFWEERA